MTEETSEVEMGGSNVEKDEPVLDAAKKDPPDEDTTLKQGLANESKNEDDPAPSCNPALSDDIRGYVDKMKGDAIGDTLYSSRFVLKILIRLVTDPQVHTPKLDESFEKELCTFWDMTIERDVVKLLLEQQVIDMFATVIESTEDYRLIEILVGIIANMCALSEAREALCHSPTALKILLDVINYPDHLILNQLMRLIYAALVFENTGDELAWFQHFQNTAFVEKFVFILKSSMQSTLLSNAYMALHAICAKFSVIEIQPDSEHMIKSFYETFVTPQMVEGVVEAFGQMCPTSAVVDSAEMAAPSKTTTRIAGMFLDICVYLSPYGEASVWAFKDHLDKVFDCIGQILQPLCHAVYLLPLTTNEQGIIELLNDLGQSLGDPFYGKCFAQMIRIWSLIDDHQRNSSSANAENSSEWDADYAGDNDDACLDDDVLMTILEFITRTSREATKEAVAEAIMDIEPDSVYRLYQALIAGEDESDIQECCTKLKAAAVQFNWNWDQTAHDESVETDQAEEQQT